MFHYYLPVKLETIGGFSNAIIIDYFKAYANLLFKRFGNRVKYWMTFNQPRQFCIDGYDDGSNPPAVHFNGVGGYICIHNILKSHAVVYHLYKNSFYDRFKGQIGIALKSWFYYSKSNDASVIDHTMQFHIGFVAHPIFSTNGNYPPLLKSIIANNSMYEGCSESRLPTFSKQWIDRIRGSADFFGLNYYTSRYIEFSNGSVGENPSFERDRNLNFTTDPRWKRAAATHLHSVAKGLGDLLR